ncbi:MAG: response regulator transcription factor [Saprospiraceae bacterium]|nr:response regulator transcription factor [Saprospiraceae bacterium]
MTTDTLYRVGIVDDEKLFISGIKMIISQHENISVDFTATNGKDLLEYLKNSPHALDVVLLDLSMPVMDGVEALQSIQQLPHYPRIIILSSHYNAGIISKMIRDGASAFLNKNEEPQEVLNTVLNVAEKGYHFNDYVFKVLRERNMTTPSGKTDHHSLSEREDEILKLICEEYTNKEIGEKLFISARTVEGHRQNLLLKTGAKNTAGLIIYAIENQIYKVRISRYH